MGPSIHPEGVNGQFEFPVGGQLMSLSADTCSFEGVHEGVRLGSYPSFSGSRPQVGLVLSSWDENELHEATEWVTERLPCTISGNA